MVAILTSDFYGIREAPAGSPTPEMCSLSNPPHGVLPKNVLREKPLQLEALDWDPCYWRNAAQVNGTKNVPVILKFVCFKETVGEFYQSPREVS